MLSERIDMALDNQQLEETTLIADVGEFALPLLPLAKEADPEALQGYLAMEPPLTGLLFQLGTDEQGAPTVTFGQGTVAYTFVRTE